MSLLFILPKMIWLMLVLSFIMVSTVVLFYMANPVKLPKETLFSKTTIANVFDYKNLTIMSAEVQNGEQLLTLDCSP